MAKRKDSKHQGSTSNNGDTFSVILGFTKKHPWIFFIYMIVICIVFPVEMYYLPKITSEFYANLFSKGNGVESLKLLLGAFVFVTFGMTLKARVENTLIPKFVIFIRKYVFKGIIEKYKIAIETLPLGKIISILAEYPNSTRNVLVQVIRTFIPYIIGILFLCGYFFFIDTNIGFLHVGILLVMGIIFWRDSKKCLKVAQEAHTDILNLSENVQDRLSNIMSVYAAQQENTEVKKHGKLEDANQKFYFKSLQCGWKSNIKIDLLLIGTLCVFSYMVFKMYNENKISKQTVMQLFMIEIYYFTTFVRRMENNSFDVINSIGNIHAIEEYLGSEFSRYAMEDNKVMLKKKKKVNILDAKKPTIEVQNITFKYPHTENYVIKDFSMTTYPNERIWLKGHSGCGKSTLLKLLMAALQPTYGTIKIGPNGYDIREVHISMIRENISFVDQHTKLFNDTILKNIMYGNEETSKEEIQEFVRSLNLDIFSKLEKGLYTSAGINGENLSGGQRQVILILRCYFRNSPIVFMDEPLSAIDPKNIDEVLELIKKITLDKTLLVISHSDKIAPLVTREIHVCKNKEIEFESFINSSK